MEETNRRRFIEDARSAVTNLQNIEPAVIIVIEHGHTSRRHFRCGKRAIRPARRFGRQALCRGHVFEVHCARRGRTGRWGLFHAHVSAASHDDRRYEQSEEENHPPQKDGCGAGKLESASLRILGEVRRS